MTNEQAVFCLCFFIKKFMHINLQEKYRQRTHSKFKFQQTFGITEQIQRAGSCWEAEKVFRAACYDHSKTAVHYYHHHYHHHSYLNISHILQVDLVQINIPFSKHQHRKLSYIIPSLRYDRARHLIVAARESLTWDRYDIPSSVYILKREGY